MTTPDKAAIGDGAALPWQTLPEAAALIADLAANPPAQRYVRGILGPNDGAVVFDDKRMRRLEEIYMTEQRRVLAECDEAKDHSAFYAMVRPEDAVAEARAATAKPQPMLAMGVGQEEQTMEREAA